MSFFPIAIYSNVATTDGLAWTREHRRARASHKWRPWISRKRKICGSPIGGRTDDIDAAISTSIRYRSDHSQDLSPPHLTFFRTWKRSMLYPKHFRRSKFSKLQGSITCIYGTLGLRNLRETGINSEVVSELPAGVSAPVMRKRARNPQNLAPQSTP